MGMVLALNPVSQPSESPYYGGRNSLIELSRHIDRTHISHLRQVLEPCTASRARLTQKPVPVETMEILGATEGVKQVALPGY